MLRNHYRIPCSLFPVIEFCADGSGLILSRNSLKKKKKKPDLIFQSSFGFTAKSRGRYGDFLCTCHPPLCTDSPTVNIPPKWCTCHFLFLTNLCGCGISSVPQAGVELPLPAVEAQSLNGWTPREVPQYPPLSLQRPRGKRGHGPPATSHAVGLTTLGDIAGVPTSECDGHPHLWDHGISPTRLSHL